jgi:membrane protein DedA with SNARE-associated domain
LAYIGLKLGERWASLRERFHNFDLIIIALIVVGLGLWVYRHFKNSK